MFKPIHRANVTPLLAATATVLLCSALPAHAAFTLYTDEAAYLAAAGVTTEFIDFAGSPGAVESGDSFSAAVTFASCPAGLASCVTQVLHNSEAITDLGGSASPNGVAALGAFFTAPVQAFAFHYISGGVASLDLFGALGGTLDTSAAGGFIGVVSDSAISSFVANNAVFPNNIGNDRYFIDDMRISAPIPEPQTWALMLGGLALLGRVARRRAGSC